MKDSTIFFISAKNLHLKIWLRSIKEKLPEYAQRGSMKAVCFNQQKAADSGLLARNFHIGKKKRLMLSGTI